ncbi:MAG: S41 family peptidase [Rhodanobacteraceae bacterium]|nr:MAG: S41 family peptidase [Rhodanobacteraceae bacterium]
MTRHPHAFLGCLLALCSSIALAAPPPAQTPAPATTIALPAPAVSSATPAIASGSSDVPSIKEIQAFTRAFEMIKQAYVEPVSNKQLMQSAIRGMLAGLDPHSEFLDKSELKNLTEDTSGAYSGLGIEVAQVNHQLVIIAPLDGGPAKRAGILPGDVIAAINGVPVQPDDIDASIKKLRGPIGSKITLDVLHPNADKPVKIALVRERIHVASVRTRMLEPGFAYIRISEFQEDTADDLTRALEKLQKEHGPLRGAVLDLRSNPGGLLTSAVGVADDFLNSGVIVSTRGRLPQSNLKFSATPGDLLNGAPMVVLVDNGTASAAEIVTGALKDNHRALIMGRRTFGKGSVQTILPLGNGDAVKLTTARYYTPNGTSIQVAGITPDIVLGNLTVSDNRNPSLMDDEHESDLPNHLAGTHAASTDADAGDLAVKDYALSEALHVLKGLALARSDVPTALSAH